MAKLILLRHGESLWNLENKFTGWTDVDLSEKGGLEAERAGRVLLRENLKPEIAFTSLLQRAVRTWDIAAHACGRMWVDVEKSWRLNERHYGALQGLNKAETAAKYGDEQVRIWRRSYDVPPPKISPDDPRNPRFEEKYSRMDCRALPLGESLKETIGRVLPFWFDSIAPALLHGRDAIVVAHGNSLRGLVKFLDKMDEAQISKFEIPTGVPILYELDETLEPVRRKSDKPSDSPFGGTMLFPDK